MENSDRTAIYKLHADFCKILADTSRLLIIMELNSGETSVNELARRLNLRQSNVSKHLSLMRDHGLVNSRRDGATIYYSVSDSRIYEAIKLLRDVQNDQIEKRSLLTRSSR
jgi:ArsR family transcriptional regulator, virulence genes transcriptional regulator